MAFPETRPTLIVRLAAGGGEADWGQFLGDYWGPIVLFARRIARLPHDQAEDVAAEMFLVLVRSPLLAKWQNSPTGKLRSLMCGVARNIISNRQRIAVGRRKILTEIVEAGGVPEVLPVHDSAEPAASDIDAFYRAWVDELLGQALQTLLAELHAEDRGDYFRALYGRLCEGLTAIELAEALSVTPATIENYLRVAKSRLSRTLQAAVRQHVARYSSAEDIDPEFQREWNSLHGFLESFGGLELAIRREAADLGGLGGRPQPSKLFLAVKNAAKKQFG
jgi:RNA polymerase sigma factor (sigma-70 family)